MQWRFSVGGQCDLSHKANKSLCVNKLEVIIDYGSAFVTYGKIKETKSSGKESSFPAEVPLIKLIGAANLHAVARDCKKISALVPQEHQVRMRSDEREHAFSQGV